MPFVFSCPKLDLRRERCRSFEISDVHLLSPFVVSGTTLSIHNSLKPCRDSRNCSDCRTVYVVVLPSFVHLISSPHHSLRNGYDPLYHSGRYSANIYFFSFLIRLPGSPEKERCPLSSWSKTMANHRELTQRSQAVPMDHIHRDV